MILKGLTVSMYWSGWVFVVLRLHTDCGLRQVFLLALEQGPSPVECPNENKPTSPNPKHPKPCYCAEEYDPRAFLTYTTMCAPKTTSFCHGHDTRNPQSPEQVLKLQMPYKTKMSKTHAIKVLKPKRSPKPQTLNHCEGAPDHIVTLRPAGLNCSVLGV